MDEKADPDATAVGFGGELTGAAAVVQTVDFACAVGFVWIAGLAFAYVVDPAEDMAESGQDVCAPPPLPGPSASELHSRQAAESAETSLPLVSGRHFLRQQRQRQLQLQYPLYEVSHGVCRYLVYEQLASSAWAGVRVGRSPEPKQFDRLCEAAHASVLGATGFHPGQ